jgi:hypothetical protein
MAMLQASSSRSLGQARSGFGQLMRSSHQWRYNADSADARKRESIWEMESPGSKVRENVWPSFGQTFSEFKSYDGNLMPAIFRTFVPA